MMIEKLTDLLRLGLIGASLLALVACSSKSENRPIEQEIVTPITADIQAETPPLFYHIFVRSFRDSDGDRHGDLRGIAEGLDYLQSLGVTGILLTPLYPSEFYHNYFADDFYGMDPEFGTMEDYTFLVSEIHARGMKIYLDQEIQYVSGNHEWYTSSSGNPDSEFSDFVLYADEGNTTPIATLWGRTEFNVWPSQKQFIYTVNMHSANVQSYFTDYLLYWICLLYTSDAADD